MSIRCPSLRATFFDGKIKSIVKRRCEYDIPRIIQKIPAPDVRRRYRAKSYNDYFEKPGSFRACFACLPILRNSRNG